jgi:hypothetical protein
MKIKDGYSIIPQNDGYIVCYNNTPLEKTIFLSEIPAFLWKLLEEKDLTTAQMLDAVLNAYEISTVLGLGEIDTFIKLIKENGIIG